jgi:hypothetical protein
MSCIVYENVNRKQYVNEVSCSGVDYVSRIVALWFIIFFVYLSMSPFERSPPSTRLKDPDDMMWHLMGLSLLRRVESRVENSVS